MRMEKVSNIFSQMAGFDDLPWYKTLTKTPRKQIHAYHPAGGFCQREGHDGAYSSELVPQSLAALKQCPFQNDFFHRSCRTHHVGAAGHRKSCVSLVTTLDCTLCN